MNLKEILYTLCKSDGVSGNERSACKAALSMLKSYTDDCFIDGFNSVIAHIAPHDESKPTLLLDAHIDRIGLIISHITSDGFIKVGKVGGPDIKTLAAQTVTVHGVKPVRGVVSVLPPHIKSSDEAMKADNIVIDTGYSADELKKLVSPGDTITFDCEPGSMIDTRFCGGALDDRSGVASVLYALELLKGKELRFNLDVSFTSQEEVGERGARIAGYNLNPDFLLEMDVSFAKTPDSNPAKCAVMGEGVMIGIAPSLSREMSNELISLAKAEKIPYQLEVMNGETGTNADSISVCRQGAKACTLSIPLKFMHTPAEMVDICDIEAVARLIAAYASERSSSND